MQNHKAWLKKASHDLKAAEVLSREKINDIAIYHAHQCVEKALKGFLAFKLCSIQKSHDLVLLTELCCRYDASFEELRSTVEFLNPLGTLLRYPSDRPDPNQNTTTLAIEKAKMLLLFVKKLLQN
ncbi:MAG: HEPN domain-containing protein [Verrucomicrobia bacterium]|nr:HEPN domain-containing protein [Verrucomicrobiota bacterium]